MMRLALCVEVERDVIDGVSFVRWGEWGLRGVALLVPSKHHVSERDEGLPLGRRPQPADVPDGFLAVTLGQEVGLLHAVTLLAPKNNNNNNNADVTVSST